MLEDCASSPLGKEKCRKLTPVSDLNEIRKMQAQTSDALKRIWQKGSISFLGINDITDSLKRLQIGSPLGIGELLRISSLLKIALRVKSFSRNQDTDQRDSLDDMFDALEPLSNLNSEITRCIISEDEIADDATANLKSIRRSIKITNDRIHSQLNSIIN